MTRTLEETTESPVEQTGTVAETPPEASVTQDAAADPVRETLEEISQSVQDVTNLIREAIPESQAPTASPEVPAVQDTTAPEAVVEDVAVDPIRETLDEIAHDATDMTTLGSAIAAESEIAAALPAEPRGGDRYSEMLVAHHDRGGTITEEYRTLRTNLLARCQDDRFCFLVTSAEPGEGKTVTCLNLAFVMAERLDHRTILVDFNLRDSRLAELLNVPPGPGVADYLAGRAAMSEIIQPTVYPNLFFISAGTTGKSQAGELLGRAQLKTLVDQIRKDYDYVLLDTPPVNRFADAGVTGLAAGDALLVVRLNRTRREAVEQAVQVLHNANINLVGMLMTHQRRQFFN